MNSRHRTSDSDTTTRGLVDNLLPAQRGLPPYKLRQALEWIATEIDRPIYLKELAAAVALSPFHFHREFKRSTGMTPRQYVVEVRIERAKSLLAESSLPLAEMAAQLGFADQSHFTAAFRRRMSMTPRSYRTAVAGGCSQDLGKRCRACVAASQSPVETGARKTTVALTTARAWRAQ